MIVPAFLLFLAACSDSEKARLDETGAAVGLLTTDDDGDGFTEDQGDCDDSDAAVNPGSAAIEACDGIDNNCDGAVDEDLSLSTYYPDLDGDGFGGPTYYPEEKGGGESNAVSACAPPNGYVANNTDCNDDSAAAYPGATEVCDGLDNDCDVEIDEQSPIVGYIDADGDGYGSTSTCDETIAVTLGGDCDDSDPAVNPTVPSPDDDCDGYIDVADGGDDCDDTNPWIHPGVLDGDDGVSPSVGGGGAPNDDANCDGVIDDAVIDQDGDGYSDVDGDCDDTSADVYPGAPEDCFNGIDDDCDDNTDGADDEC